VAGGLLGTAIVGGLGVAYTWTFLVSGIGRVTVAILSPAWLVTLSALHVRRGRMVTRVVAWTPHGGPIRQLLPPSPARSESPTPGPITDPDRATP
jgi:hypothetical protein